MWRENQFFEMKKFDFKCRQKWIWSMLVGHWTDTQKLAAYSWDWNGALETTSYENAFFQNNLWLGWIPVKVLEFNLFMTKK